MGRKKIQIEKIADDRNRQVTFTKRKFGLFKKSYELSVLCECDIAVIIFKNGKLYQFSSTDIEKIIQSHGNFEAYESLNSFDIENSIQKREQSDKKAIDGYGVNFHDRLSNPNPFELNQYYNNQPMMGNQLPNLNIPVPTNDEHLKLEFQKQIHNLVMNEQRSKPKSLTKTYSDTQLIDKRDDNSPRSTAYQNVPRQRLSYINQPGINYEKHPTIQENTFPNNEALDIDVEGSLASSITTVCSSTNPMNIKLENGEYGKWQRSAPCRRQSIHEIQTSGFGIADPSMDQVSFDQIHKNFDNNFERNRRHSSDTLCIQNNLSTNLPNLYKFKILLWKLVN